MAWRIVPQDNDVLVWMFLFQFRQEDELRLRIHLINAQEMKAISREWGHGREQIPIGKGLLMRKDSPLPDLITMSGSVYG